MTATVGSSRDSRSIGQQQRRFQNEEFRSAVRALLMTPLISPDHEDFPAIRRQAGRAARFLCARNRLAAADRTRRCPAL